MPTNGGTISPPSNSYERGQSVSLNATPASDYIFKEWRGSITGTQNPITFSMDADKQVTGVFEKKAVIPTVSIGENPLNLSSTSADFVVKIIDNGGGTIVTSGVCWSTSPVPTINDFKSLNLGSIVNNRLS